MSIQAQIAQVREYLGSAYKGLETLLEQCPSDDSRLYGLLRYASQALDQVQNGMDMANEHTKGQAEED